MKRSISSGVMAAMVLLPTLTVWPADSQPVVKIEAGSAGVKPPVRAASPKPNASPRIVLHNDPATQCVSVQVDGAEAFVYRYSQRL